jgi:hypothetical protein
VSHDQARYTMLTPDEIAALPDAVPRTPKGQPTGFSRDSYRRHRAAFDAEVAVHKAEIRSTGALTLRTAPVDKISFRCRVPLVLLGADGKETRDICRRRKGHDAECSPKWRS